ncbi:MAG: sigma-54 dependent transcriptional regulator [Acidobacteriota bacterium]|jgi:two-component system, NtrC family, response regulator HydG
MSKPVSILIVDDEFTVRDSLQAWFRDAGYRVEVAASGREALNRMARENFDLYLLDIKMAGMDGLELQERIRENQENPVIIIMTAYASVDTAVQALKQGAFDYITKPFDPDDLEHLVRNAVEKYNLKRENLALKARLDQVTAYGDIIGESPGIKKVLELIETVAPTDASVLIRGESGTGKELVARAIHHSSPRRYMPFLTVNCGALPESLLESELFGHERGAFTGAQYRRKGKFELSDGGTLFLDEVGDVSLKTQTDLLRVLEDKKITRLGGSKPIPVDFRTVAATNRDLEAMVEEKTFRDDLYYRLNVFQIQVPPLRDRREDIPLLVDHFVSHFSREMNRPIRGVSKEVMNMLQIMSWPGNIRELKNTVERAVVLCQGGELKPEHFPLNGTMPAPAPSHDLSLTSVERQHIQRVLHETAWNISRAARVLGIDRATLYNKIKRYELKKAT